MGWSAGPALVGSAVAGCWRPAAHLCVVSVKLSTCLDDCGWTFKLEARHLLDVHLVVATLTEAQVRGVPWHNFLTPCHWTTQRAS